ncbi:MAG TPA: ABC transporter permease subunit [Myxococcota bacterium]|nr:ABC transporter permease subunit [Myxococcota bacterium]HQK50356.1 ABC transporter permease subunit [Myxococcota bacterium]
MNAWQDAWRIARFDLETALRTRRLVLWFAIYLLVALITAMVLVKIETSVGDQIGTLRALAQAPAGTDEEANKFLKGLSFLTGGDTEIALQMVRMPLIVTGFFWSILTFLPGLILLTSHDMINGEVRNRSTRFVLLRTTRTALLLGKTISHLSLALVATLLANLLVLIYGAVRLPSMPLLQTSGLLLRFFALGIPYALCWVSLTALVSSLLDSGPRSLVTLGVLLMVFQVLSLNSDVGFLSPLSHRLGLWSGDLLKVGMSVAIYLIFAGVFWAGTWWRITRRDL